MTRHTVRVMRMVLNTDRNPDEDPEYPGNFSDPFVIENAADIVAVDWSVPGEVAITFLIPSTRGAGAM